MIKTHTFFKYKRVADSTLCRQPTLPRFSEGSIGAVAESLHLASGIPQGPEHGLAMATFIAGKVAPYLHHAKIYAQGTQVDVAAGQTHVNAGFNASVAPLIGGYGVVPDAYALLQHMGLNVSHSNEAGEVAISPGHGKPATLWQDVSEMTSMQLTSQGLLRSDVLPHYFGYTMKEGKSLHGH
jgi:hypothetical protein